MVLKENPEGNPPGVLLGIPRVSRGIWGLPLGILWGVLQEYPQNPPRETPRIRRYQAIPSPLLDVKPFVYFLWL